MNQKKLSWMISALFVVPALTSVHAQAQTTKADDAPVAGDVQKVSVTGIRAAMRSALDRKEASNSMIEVIASEDIGKLPDTTIAESLAKIPGLSSGIDRGNASQITARGLDTRFVGATLNGREIASADPGRAVRFDQFPSESISGANINKTQSAELVEGGISTTIDLQTVQPLTYKGRQLSFKADALMYGLARDVPGTKKAAPRVGGIYIDQFLNNTLGVTLAGSYQKQPDIRTMVDHWGFNADHSVDLTGDGKIDRTPWGFADVITRGTNERSSALGKVEWKPNADTLLTADIYYAKADLLENGAAHYYQGLGNWDGGDSARYANVDSRNGYVVGATVRDVYLHTDAAEYKQATSNLAGGLNAKFKVGEWKAEADLSSSVGEARSVWQDLFQDSKQAGTLNWSFPGGDVQNYKYTTTWNQNDPASFGTPHGIVADTRHLKDTLNAFQFNMSQQIKGDHISKIKFGTRFTDREKNLEKFATWNPENPAGAIPASAYDNFTVPGFATSFLGLNDFGSTFRAVFGPDSLNAAGRAHDIMGEWRVTEKTSSLYGQVDLDGTMFGLSYRGNVGARYVHTAQMGYGTQQLTGESPKAVADGITYNQFLPSSNLVFNLDEAAEHQLRFGLGRAMSRSSLDELRATRALYADISRPELPYTGSAGNPRLLPMLSDQLDIAYQHYFGKGNMFSAALFFKNISRYVGLKTEKGTINNHDAVLYQSVNTEGGQVRGAEFIYQQAFTGLPGLLANTGIYTNYTYTQSNIKEPGDGTPFNLSGLVPHNAGLTLWYEKDGFEMRMAANYKSKSTRNPYWTAAEGFVTDSANTWVALNFSQKLDDHFQVHFGIDNLTNQHSIFQTGTQYSQRIENTGRRFNLGVSYKM